MKRLMNSAWTFEVFPEYMERNFKNVKGTPYWPIRVCRNRAGPREENLIATAMARKIGDRMVNAIELPAMSMARLVKREIFFASSRCIRSGYNLVLFGSPVS